MLFKLGYALLLNHVFSFIFQFLGVVVELAPVSPNQPCKQPSKHTLAHKLNRHHSKIRNDLGYDFPIITVPSYAKDYAKDDLKSTGESGTYMHGDISCSQRQEPVGVEAQSVEVVSTCPWYWFYNNDQDR